jgi:hypothetical protein
MLLTGKWMELKNIMLSRQNKTDSRRKLSCFLSYMEALKKRHESKRGDITMWKGKRERWKGDVV